MKKIGFVSFCAMVFLLTAGVAMASSTVIASASVSRSYTQGCGTSTQFTFDQGHVTSSHLTSHCSGGPCEIQLVASVSNECCSTVYVEVYKNDAIFTPIFEDDFSVCTNGAASDSIVAIVDTDADADDSYVVLISEEGPKTCSSTCEQEDATLTAQLKVGTF